MPIITTRMVVVNNPPIQSGHLTSDLMRHYLSLSARRKIICRFQCSSSVLGKSVRTWAPRLSWRCKAASIINRARQSMFCNSQPPGSENCRDRTYLHQWLMFSVASVRPSASRRTPTSRHIRLFSELRMSARFKGSVDGSTRGFSITRARKVSCMAAAAREAPAPADAPKTMASIRLFEASRLAPCKPVEVTSPAAQSPVSVVRPCRSTETPPIM